MRYAKIFILMLALLLPQATYAQTRKPKTSVSQINIAADRAWWPFFAKFRFAVNRRDREALKKMMIPSFHYSSGHHGADFRDSAFRYWDGQNGRGWKAFRKILSQGTVPMARWWNNGNDPDRPSRVAPAAANRRVNINRGHIDWYAIFEYREDGHWYCVIFKECCD